MPGKEMRRGELFGVPCHHFPADVRTRATCAEWLRSVPHDRYWGVLVGSKKTSRVLP